MKRFFDFIFSIVLLIIFIVPSIAIAIAIKLTSQGHVLYWSDRVGKNNVIFKMPKFRTMKIDTPELASHLLTNSSDALTPVGNFLRRYRRSKVQTKQDMKKFINNLNRIGYCFSAKNKPFFIKTIKAFQRLLEKN